MSEHVLEPVPTTEPAPAAPARRHHQDEALILSELSPDAVVDHLDNDHVPKALITFGNVRETCPRCGHTHLKLVLRQRCVRFAHLFCAECHGCFDAHYPNGASALTI